MLYLCGSLLGNVNLEMQLPLGLGTDYKYVCWHSFSRSFPTVLSISRIQWHFTISYFALERTPAGLCAQSWPLSIVVQLISGGPNFTGYLVIASSWDVIWTLRYAVFKRKPHCQSNVKDLETKHSPYQSSGTLSLWYQH